MQVRTFSMSQSLNGSVATLTSTAAANSETNPPDVSARNTTNFFPETSRDPLSRYRQNHKPGITFAHEDQLPKLPIPDLESSCKKRSEERRVGKECKDRWSPYHY